MLNEEQSPGLKINQQRVVEVDGKAGCWVGRQAGRLAGWATENELIRGFQE